MTTLLQPSDIALYTGVDVTISTCNFREIWNIEYREARKCIGFDLWEAMIAAKADYSAATSYVVGSYSEGDVVEFQGVYKRAKTDTSNPPTVKTDWENAPRFDEENTCASLYETIFCDFLGPYLANKVLGNKLPYIWRKISDKGIVVYNGNEFKASDKEDFDRLISAIYRDANIIWDNLKYFMQDYESNT